MSEDKTVYGTNSSVIKQQPLYNDSSLKIAIDPGNTDSAFILFSDKTIIDKGKVENTFLKKIIWDHSPDFAVIEMIASYGMAVGKSVFETCLFIGQLQQLIGMDKHQLVYRKDIKMHLCGSMRAKDANIRQALIDRYGSPGTKKEQGGTYGISKDVWSALAVMTYYIDTNK